jgi:hypothetical protein
MTHKKRKLIPFALLPGHWGLEGETRELARADYELTGLDRAEEKIRIRAEYNSSYTVTDREIDLANVRHEFGKLSEKERDLRIVQVSHKGVNAKVAELGVRLKYEEMLPLEHDIAVAELTVAKQDLPRHLLDIRRKHGDIAEKEYHEECARLELKDDEMELRLLEIQHRYGDLSDREFAKAVATLKKEPYVDVLDLSLTSEGGGFFELDWNDQFILKLQDSGYTGRTDEEIVNKWFNGICRQILLAEMNDQDYGMEPASDIIYRRDLDLNE